LAWLAFKERRTKEALINQQAAALLRLNQPGIATTPLGPALFQADDEFSWAATIAVQGQLPPPRSSGVRLKTPTVLALRAARQAIRASPDHPDGYFALAQVLADRDFPIPDGDRTVAQVTALRQCLLRLPPPAEFRRGFYLTSPTIVTRTLARLYLGRRYPTGDFQGERVDAGAI